VLQVRGSACHSIGLVRFRVKPERSRGLAQRCIHLTAGVQNVRLERMRFRKVGIQCQGSIHRSHPIVWLGAEPAQAPLAPGQQGPSLRVVRIDFGGAPASADDGLRTPFVFLRGDVNLACTR